MANIFFTSDQHFGHKGMVNFTRHDGTKLRPFYSVEEMNETLVYNYNKVVKPGDIVYFLGDVFLHKGQSAIISRLNGTKKLILGNHDKEDVNFYRKHFTWVRAYGLNVNRLIMSHIPIHPESLGRWRANLHGHTHYRCLDDPRYVNVCVENTNYTPISLEDVEQELKKRGL